MIAAIITEWQVFVKRLVSNLKDVLQSPSPYSITV